MACVASPRLLFSGGSAKYERKANACPSIRTRVSGAGEPEAGGVMGAFYGGGQAGSAAQVPVGAGIK
ncbi:hypothetical protein DAETH_09520 [Deinococcus aetherius]|uniref:Uncharacterized protein n=1 Tax=Deinococcus aetherius TaxID=200252 RepID=A0ABN6REA1_9DEIO|nr:hypothetical protein DAETH_09520 [Deinococcus aetherius]